VAALQAQLGGDRYLMSPLALNLGVGRDPLEWSRRLYGLMNAPYRLRACGSFGEPLVPRPNYAVMDALFSAPGAGAAAALMPWVDARILLTPGPVPGTPGLAPAGAALWTLTRLTGPSSPAYFFEEGKEPPGELKPLPVAGRPLALSRPREDRYEVEGSSERPGWVYVGEPRYPGWRARLEDEGGARPVEPEPAMTAFQKIPVPAGRWRLTFRYDPESWRRGRLLTLVAAALLAFYGRLSLRRWQTTY
jgi:hypothetical protein